MERYTRFALVHARAILLVASAVLVLGAGLATRLRVQGDFVELLPSTSEKARRFRAALSRKGGGDSTLVVIVKSPSAEKNRAFVDAIEQRLRGLVPELAKSVDTGPREIRAYFEQFRWLFLSRDDLARAECELEHEVARHSPGYLGMDEPCAPAGNVAADEASSTSPGKRTDDGERLRKLRAEIEQRVREADRFPDGYYRTPDGSVYALVIRARRAGMGETTSDVLLERVSRIATEVAQAMGGLDVGFGGDIPTAIAEREALLDDIGIVSVAAVLLVFGSIVAFFRSGRALLYVGACVGVGTSVAFGIAALAFGRLNAATSFLGSIIVGNGINYSIIYLARYTEQRRSGLGLRDAALDAAVTCSRATWLAALAASLSYLSLAATSFRGFSEFGVIGGVGMVACWLATFLLLPACIAIFDGKRSYAVAIDGRRGFSLPGWLTKFASEHPRPIAIAAAAVLLASLVPAAQYLRDPWEYNFSRLRSQSSDRAGANHYSSLADKVFVSRGAPVLVLADTMNEAPEVARRALAVDRKENHGKFLEKAETIFERLGGEPEEVREKLDMLGRIRGHVDALSRHLSGDDLTAVREFRPPESLRAPRVSDLPKQLLEQFTETNGRVGTPVYLTLKRGISQSRGENLLKISDLLDTLRSGSGAPLANAGRATVFAEMIRSMTHDAPRATLLSLLAVIVVSLLVTSEVRSALCVLASLLLAVVLLVATAALSGLRLNFLNFVALPLTFGIGVEYAINIQDRARFVDGIRNAGRSVGGAVALCSLTTIFGYGALLFADNLALQSFGHYAIVGEVVCLGSALIVLPAMLTLLAKKNARRSSDAALNAAQRQT
jgi:predicted RND superfamily exporter protein